MKLEDYKPSPPAQVACSTDATTLTLEFVREFKHQPARVWQALTDKTRIPKWAPYGPDRNLDAVGPALLTMHYDTDPSEYEITVDEVIPDKLLRHSWGESVLEWKLEATAAGSRLTLYHTVPEPEWITSAAAGWHLCLDFAELLMDGIEFGPIAPAIGEAALTYGWEKLAEYYGGVLDVPDAKDASDASDASNAKEGTDHSIVS